MRVISRNRSRVMMGSETLRFGSRTSTCSATSRRSASRTGIGLMPKDLARLRMVMVEPGAMRPVIRACFSCW